MINSMGYMLTQYIVCHDKQYGLHAYMINNGLHAYTIVCHDKQYGLHAYTIYMLTQYIVCHDKQYGLHAYTIYSLS